MKHARSDYDRFQDPALYDNSLLPEGSTPIGADEPVMLFRAQDKLFISVLNHYRDCLLGTGNKIMVRMVDDHIRAVREWQDAHGCKYPDVPKEVADEASDGKDI